MIVIVPSAKIWRRECAHSIECAPLNARAQLVCSGFFSRYVKAKNGTAALLYKRQSTFTQGQFRDSQRRKRPISEKSAFRKLLKSMPEEGIEPPTHALRMRCSTS